MYILGFDIGGTKCAAVTAGWDGENIRLLKRVQCATDTDVTADEMLNRLMNLADGILTQKPDKIGISCGGPLDSKKGVILSPPNLPGWDKVEIADIMESHYGIRPNLQNDANAGAVAEWKFGAGRGAQNVIFLTFGTGLGAGLILNGRLYEGANGNAGEVGHIRLCDNGPVGYGKAGSFEGFCSGGGISQLGYIMALEMAEKGEYPLYYRKGMTQKDVTAKSVAEAAAKGDGTAMDVYRICGEQLGKGLSMLIDILNPEKIIIGSIFKRSYHLLWEHTKGQIEKEALSVNAQCCEVVPAELGEQTGDYAAIATALL